MSAHEVHPEPTTEIVDPESAIDIVGDLDEGCQVCISLPPEEMMARLDSCRVLQAMLLHTSPRQFEVSIEVLSAVSIAAGSATKTEVDEHVADTLGITASSAGTHFVRTRKLVGRLLGEDALVVERDPTTKQYSYTLDPAVIGERCESDAPLIPSGAQELPPSYKNIQKDAETIKAAFNFIMTPAQDPEATAAGIRLAVIEAVEKLGLTEVAASLSAAQKKCLSERYIRRYLSDPDAARRLSHLNEIIREISNGLRPLATDAEPDSDETEDKQEM